jgi:peroxiredoxin Q/BCP
VANASDTLRVGDTAPDFTLTDAASGQEFRQSQWAGRDVLLVFFRGTWCPFCRQQMRTLTERHAELCASGVQVVGVVCQSAASAGRWVRANPLPFPLLVDETRAVAKAYGVHYWLSAEGFNLARPSLFILDGAGKITFRYVGRNMRDLPVTTVLERFIGLLAES